MKLWKKFLLIFPLVCCFVLGTACGANNSGNNDGVKDPADQTEPDGDDNIGNDPSSGDEEEPSDEPFVQSLTFEESLNEDYINWYGRCRYDADGSRVDFSNGSSGFEVAFTGTELTATIASTPSTRGGLAGGAEGNPYVYVFLDGETNYENATRVELTGVKLKTPIDYVLLENLKQGNHTAKVLKCTEEYYGRSYLNSLGTDGGFKTPPEKPSLKFEIIGDSIMSGNNVFREYGVPEVGLTSVENTLASYGYMTAQLFGAQVNAVSRSGARVSDYGGAANIPSFYDQYNQTYPVPWDFSLYQPDVIILDLGTNDVPGGSFDVPTDRFIADYVKFVKHLREVNPNAEIFCCAGAMGTDAFRYVQQAVNAVVESGDEHVYYFYLPKVSDGVGHPNVEDSKINSVALAAFIRETLGWNEAE